MCKHADLVDLTPSKEGPREDPAEDLFLGPLLLPLIIGKWEMVSGGQIWTVGIKD